MAIINEILEFAGSADSGNMLEQSVYEAEPGRLAGHEPGLASQALENAALRNLSRFCRGVAQFIALGYSPGVVNDGDPAKIVTGLQAVIGSAINAAIDTHDGDTEAHADIRALIAGMSGARYESIYVGAGAMLASRTAGATLGVDETSTNKLTEEYMSFGNTADTSAEFSCKLPENWDRGSVKVRLHWKPAGGTAGQVVGLLVAAGVSGDGDTLDRALGTAVTVSDAALAGLATVEHVTAASVALTVGGTMAAGKRLHFKITRDYDYAVGGSALAAAALLLGIEIQYRTSGSVAAWS